MDDSAGTFSSPLLDSFPAFQLYKHEAFSGGSAAAERKQFRAHVKKVLDLQRRLADKSDHKPRRVFHAKGHGALIGELRLRPDRPNATRHGLFAGDSPGSYPVLARFSNASGAIQADAMPDGRGVALRLYQLAAQGVERQMDLLMSNSPIPFGRDHADFVEFGVAAQNPAALLGFLATHPEIALALVRSTAFPPVGGMTTVTFWSGHAYLLGPDRAVKFKLSPALDQDGIFRRAAELFPMLHDPNFLAADLKARAAQEEIRFTLSLQLESDDQEQTPVENTLVEWTEEASEPVPVADLVFPRQQVTDAANALADRMAFTVWNYLPEHRPLGNMARGRLFSYAASAAARHAVPTMSYADFRAEWDRAANAAKSAASHPA